MIQSAQEVHMKSIRALTLSSLFVASLAACSSQISGPDAANTRLIEDDTNENVLEVSQDLTLNAANAWTGILPVGGTAAGNTVVDVSVNSSNVAFVLVNQSIYRINALGGVLGARISDLPFKAVTTDSSGVVYAVGAEQGGSLYAAVRKLNIDAPLEYSRRTVDGALDDGATGVGVDAQGNYYMGGYTCGGQTFDVFGETPDPQTSNGLCDHFITKYTPNGTKLWSRLLGSSGNEIVGKLSVASNGSIMITGSTTGSFPGFTNAGGTDVYVARFDTNGNRRWVKQFGTPQNDNGIDVTFDFGGGVYVTGTSLGAFNGQVRYKNVGVSDGFVMRLNSSTGNVLWAKLTSAAYGFAGCIGTAGCKQSATQVFDLAVDGYNNVYLTGVSPNGPTTSPFGDNIIVPSGDIGWPIKFDVNGAIKGVTKNSPTLPSNTLGRAVAVAPGGVYLAYDQFFGGAGPSQPYLARFDFNLNLTK
jgi:Beta-propeller repeat